MQLRLTYWTACIVVILVALLPLLTLGFRLPTRLDLLPALFESATFTSLFYTVTTGVVALLLSLMIAIPVAFFLARTDIHYSSLFRRFFLFPYFVPPYLFAVAWITLALPEVGFLNRILGVNLFNIYSLTGMVFVFATAHLAILLTPILSALDQMDPSLEEAARIFGAGPFKTFTKITLPCLYPTLVSSSLLFVLSIFAAFGIPGLIGIPARIPVLTTKIYSLAKLGGLTGIDEAFIVSLWLIFLCVGLHAANDWVIKKFSVRLVSGKVPRHSKVRLGKWRAFACFCMGTLCFSIVVLPLLSIALSSFLRIAGDLSPSNFTFHNYRYLLQMPEAGRALSNSLLLAFGTSILCLVLGFAVAYFKERTVLRERSLMYKLAILPFSVPGTVIALGALISYGTGWGIPELSLLGSLWLLLVTYSGKYLALSVQMLVPELAKIHPSLDEAGRIFGASRFGVVRKILVPLLRPILLSILVLTALPVFSELTMSVLLYGPGTETIGTLMFELQDYANPLAACSLATLVVLFVAILMMIQSKFEVKSERG